MANWDSFIGEREEAVTTDKECRPEISSELSTQGRDTKEHMEHGRGAQRIPPRWDIEKQSRTGIL